jgi:predicted metal-binding membrane protein
LTPLKQVCLQHCRSPLGFLLTNWRDDFRGAFRMGLQHGTYCLGCCWLLMALLFVVGVMNLVWLAVLTVFVLLEKVAPAGIWLSRVTGLLLVGGSLWVIAEAVLCR